MEKRSREHRQKLSEASYRYYNEHPEAHQRISNALRKYYKEHPKIVSFATRKKMREAAKCRWENPEYRYKMGESQRGKCISPEQRRKISKAHKGMHHTEETKRKISEAKKGKRFTEEHKHKLREASKERFNNPMWMRKWIESFKRKPNRAELKLDAILQEVCPGEFALNVRANIMTLGGKIPDFVNMNGKKQLIELYGDYWHRGEDPQDRIDYFRQFGDWDTLIIWEHELKDEAALKRKLRIFTLGVK